MLIPKNFTKKKIKKVKAKDEVDEEGYVKPKSAYELLVVTNPTADQLDLLFQWNSLMTSAEKEAFEREAMSMRKAYDELKAGMVAKEHANDILKRKDTGVQSKAKRLPSLDRKGTAAVGPEKEPTEEWVDDNNDFTSDLPTDQSKTTENNSPDATKETSVLKSKGANASSGAQ